MTIQSGSFPYLPILAHLYTALGVLWGLFAAYAIASRDYREAFLWLLIALVVDSTDGFLARKFRVKEELSLIDGRRLDDLIDYLNYSFLPLFMIGWAGWIASPAWLWVTVALLTSLYAFSRSDAKSEGEGYFLGFPSYWNVFALYVFLWLGPEQPILVLVLLLLFSLLNVLPIRFVYPSHARRFKYFFTWGALVWLALVFVALFQHPDVSIWLVRISFLYPAFYIGLSLGIHFGNPGEE
jgi:phosphatidylcholine synthase